MAALKSKNTTQMIFEINLFIRDQNYLFHLLLQWYMTQPPLTSGTFAANWRAIHAQPSQSAYLHSSPLSSQRSDLLRVWRDTVRCRWIRNDPRSAIPSHWQHLLSQYFTLPSEDHWWLLTKTSSETKLFRMEHSHRPHREDSHFQIHIWFLYPYRIRLE